MYNEFVGSGKELALQRQRNTTQMFPQQKLEPEGSKTKVIEGVEGRCAWVSQQILSIVLFQQPDLHPYGSSLDKEKKHSSSLIISLTHLSIQRFEVGGVAPFIEIPSNIVSHLQSQYVSGYWQYDFFLAYCTGLVGSFVDSIKLHVILLLFGCKLWFKLSCGDPAFTKSYKNPILSV